MGAWCFTCGDRTGLLGTGDRSAMRAWLLTNFVLPLPRRSVLISHPAALLPLFRRSPRWKEPRGQGLTPISDERAQTSGGTESGNVSVWEHSAPAPAVAAPTVRPLHVFSGSGWGAGRCGRGRSEGGARGGGEAKEEGCGRGGGGGEVNLAGQDWVGRGAGGSRSLGRAWGVLGAGGLAWLGGGRGGQRAASGREAAPRRAPEWGVGWGRAGPQGAPGWG